MIDKTMVFNNTDLYYLFKRLFVIEKMFDQLNSFWNAITGDSNKSEKGTETRKVKSKQPK